MRAWIIYTLSDPRTAAVRYVGITFRGTARRLTEHLSRAAKGGRTHRDCWIRSLLLVGLRPVMATVETGQVDQWQEREQHWIRVLRQTCDLVNLTDGGDGTLGCVPSSETRAKLSAIRKGKKYAHLRPGGMKGKRHSAEAVEKIRAASTGRQQGEEAKRKVSAARKGKALSPAHCKKIGDLKRGKKLTLEHRAKIAAATTGRKPVLCVETSTKYPSITAASRAISVTEASIYGALKRGGVCRGNHFRFL